MAHPHAADTSNLVKLGGLHTDAFLRKNLGDWCQAVEQLRERLGARDNRVLAKVPYFRIYDLRSTYATRLSAGGVADEWVTQLLRQGDAKVFQEVFPDETADEARGSGKVEPDGKRAERERRPELWHSEGELMGFDTVLTQFATKTQQNEGLRKGPRIRKFTDVI